MDIAVITALISGVATVICALIAHNNRVENERRAALDEANEKRSELRAKEGRLQLRLIAADMALTVGLADALKTGKCNGNLDHPLEEVKAAQAEYQSFLEGLALDNIRK